MGWSDVAGKFLDFLKDPSSRGVITLALIFAFLIYAVPIGVMAWIHITTTHDSTNRIVTAIQDLKVSIQTSEKVAYRK